MGNRMRVGRRRLALISIFGLVVSPLFGAVAAAASSSPRTGPVTITLYNGQHQQTTDSLVKSFEAVYPNVKVSVRNDDEDTLADDIVQEGSRSPADVFYTENSPALQYLAQQNLLARVLRSTLAKTPGKYSSPDAEWVGVSARVSVLIYNPKLISRRQLPTKVLQLAGSQYKGKLAIAAGETDFQPIVTSVLDAYGKSRTLTWLTGLKSNAGGHVYPDDETIADEVNRGQVAFGIVNQYYWYRMQAEVGKANMHSQIAYFTNGDPGYVLDVSTAGVLKSSRHLAAAQEFLAFLVSKKGQEIIAHSISFEYPIASGVTTAQPETPFRDLHPNPIDLAQLGTGAQAIALLQDVQLL